MSDSTDLLGSTETSRNVDASTLLDSTENIYHNAETLGGITLVNMQVYERIDMIGALTQRSHASRDLWNVDFEQRKVAVLLVLCLGADRSSRSQAFPAERSVVVGEETWVAGSLPTDLLVQPALQQPYFDVTASPAVPDFLRDLHEVPNEADEEGYPVPPKEILQLAERLGHKILPFCKRKCEVYPTPDGEVALDVSSERRSLIIIIEPSATVLCLVNIDGKKRWKRFGSIDYDKTIKFVRDIAVKID